MDEASRRVFFLYVGFMGAAFSAGCWGDDPLDAVLVDGTSVQSLTGKLPEEVLLVFDPADTGACFSAYSTWQHWARHPQRNMIFLLTRPPSDTERTTMRYLGVYEDGVLRRSPSLETPYQVLLAQGHGLLIREGVTEQDADEFIKLLSEIPIQQHHSP